jgi:hypothetical protein
MCVTAMAASAQSDDFGIWTSLEIQKKIDKKWSVGLEAEMRTRDDVKTVDRWSGGLDVSYKILKGLKVSAGYTFLWDNNERISYYEEGDKKVINGAVNAGDPKKRAQYWGPRHRFSVSLTGEKSFGPWGFSLRERWQYTYRPEHTVAERWSYYDEDWDGEEHTYPGLFDTVVFNDSVKEFLCLRRELADYFDEAQTEDIFDYIPPQKTNQIFTPKWVV